LRQPEKRKTGFQAAFSVSVSRQPENQTKQQRLITQSRIQQSFATEPNIGEPPTFHNTVFRLPLLIRIKAA
jgi:hypothetical protein